VFVGLGVGVGVLLAAQTDGSGSRVRGETTSTPLPTIKVARPLAPVPYRLPKGAARVSSSAELVSALERGPRNIVLAAGVYDNARPFSNPHGRRLYAARRGGAVLRAGIVLGAHDGPQAPLLRGLRFDVADRAKTLHGAIVHVWGSAKNARVLDTWLDGNGRVDSGLTVRQPEGFVARRIVATGFRSYGVLVDPHESDYRARSPYALSDLTISDVARPARGSSDGTAEACLWLGSRGNVRRVQVRRCALIGVWTGTANDRSQIADVAVDRTPVGIYVEHFTSRTTFRRLYIGPNVSRGLNAEWANPDRGGRPASTDNVIRDSYFSTVLVGVYLDDGTTRTSVVGSKFVGQKWAAIGDYRGVDNSFSGNDFSGIGPDAVPISTEHIKRGKSFALGDR
jgi:hypothetical protein